MVNKALLIINTVKYLKFIQIFNRVKRKLIKLSPDLSGASSIIFPKIKVCSFIEAQEKMLNENEFKFLNIISSVQKKEDWNSNKHEKLWLYNLHYFDDLNAFNSHKRLNWHRSLIENWIDNNPPGYGNGWEAYPSSLRIVNWIKWILSGNSFEKEWLDSLTIQLRYLSINLEKHLLGNHLFSNGKALLFGGLIFQGDEAKEWYKVGLNILENELPKQVLEDGGNFELSPMYHGIFLEDLLDIVNLHQSYNIKLPSNVNSSILNMINWLKIMNHPDGNISFFNDATNGISPSLADLLNYALKLNIDLEPKANNTLTYLKSSGYVRVAKNDFVSIIDLANIGPDYLPGHGHADALSFELSLFSKRVIVNSGISTYEIGNDRHYQRGTSSHSTITIDEENSSEVWDGFRVARRSRVKNIHISQSDLISISACHDGYHRLKGKPSHCREWIFYEKKIEIIDNISGSGDHKIKSVLPIHPDVLVLKIDHSYVELEVQGNKINIKFEGIGELQVVSSNYYPGFGETIMNKQLIYSYNGVIPFKLKTRISW